MATLHISFRTINDAEMRVIHPTRNNPPLLSTEIEEHPYTLSNEIWDMMTNELEHIGKSGNMINRESVSVTIDTDDNQTIQVPKNVILRCFNR